MSSMSSLAAFFAPDAVLKSGQAYCRTLLDHALSGSKFLHAKSSPQDPLMREAIRILKNPARPDMDECEWAERYLNGLSEVPREAFMENRRSQS